MVEGRTQDLDTVNCSIFQIYFYDNLFIPDQNSIIQKRLNKKTVETLLNELFILNNQEQNEVIINEHADKRNIITEQIKLRRMS